MLRTRVFPFQPPSFVALEGHNVIVRDYDASAGHRSRRYINSPIRSMVAFCRTDWDESMVVQDGSFWRRASSNEQLRLPSHNSSSATLLALSESGEHHDARQILRPLPRLTANNLSSASSCAHYPC